MKNSLIMAYNENRWKGPQKNIIIDEIMKG